MLYTYGSLRSQQVWSMSKYILFDHKYKHIEAVKATSERISYRVHIECPRQTPCVI